MELKQLFSEANKGNGIVIEAMPPTALFPMSKEDYIACGGNKCPYCGVSDIDCGSLETTGPDKAYRRVWCNDCGTIWVEHLILAGYESC